MITKTPWFSLRAVPAALVLLALAVVSPLHAGTPLICFPYEIGQARSLPGDKNGPKGVNATYDRTRLVSETLALLTPEMPVIVRMETIRRAVVYAVKGEFFLKAYPEDDKKLVAGLLAGLQRRVERKVLPAQLQALLDRGIYSEEMRRYNVMPEQALGLFDLGFCSETLRQAGVDSSLDGYSILKQAVTLRGPDAEMEFALALASSWPKGDQFAFHLAKAKAGATKEKGSLLAQNLASHLSGS
jgi:hypothetical protein